MAEPAIVVADDWQGRGLASHLLDALVDRAREEGVERFVAPVLADNTAAIRLLERLGETDERAARPRGPALDRPARARPREPAAARAAARRGHRHRRAGAHDLAARRLGPPAGDRASRATRSWWARTARRARARRCAAPAISRASAAPRCTSWPRTGCCSTTAPSSTRSLARGGRGPARRRACDVDAHLRRGDAAEALMDVAAEQEARLIVVGPRDLGGGRAAEQRLRRRRPPGAVQRAAVPRRRAGRRRRRGAGGQRRRRSADVALAPPVSRAAPAPAAAPTRGFGSRRCCRPSW